MSPAANAWTILGSGLTVLLALAGCGPPAGEGPATSQPVGGVGGRPAASQPAGGARPAATRPSGAAASGAAWFGRDRKSADQALAAKRWGNALVGYLLADAADPFAVPKPLFSQCLVNIRARLAFRIAVLVGSDRARFDRLDVLEPLQPAIFAELAAVKPDNATVLKPEQLAKAMAEHDLVPSDFFGTTADLAAARLAGVDGLVLVRVEGLTLATDRTQTTGKRTVAAGTRKVDNPNYARSLAERDSAAAKAADLAGELGQLEGRQKPLADSPPSTQRDQDLSELERRIGQGRNDLKAARADLASAERFLTETPRQIEQPVRAEAEFPVLLYTRTATLTAAVQVVEPGAGKSLLKQIVTAAVSATDRMPGELAAAPPAEAANLPDETEMVRRVVARTVDAVAASVEPTLYRFNDRSLAQAQAAIAEKKPAAAVERLVDFLVANPSDGPAADGAFNSLLDLIGRDPLSARLRDSFRARCQLLRPPVRLPADIEQRDDELWLTRLDAPAGGKPAIQTPCRVLALAGRPLHTLAAVNAVLAQFSPGDSLALDVGDRNYTTRIFLVVGPGRR